MPKKGSTAPSAKLIDEAMGTTSAYPGLRWPLLGASICLSIAGILGLVAILGSGPVPMPEGGVGCSLGRAPQSVHEPLASCFAVLVLGLYLRLRRRLLS